MPGVTAESLAGGQTPGVITATVAAAGTLVNHNLAHRPATIIAVCKDTAAVVGASLVYDREASTSTQMKLFGNPDAKVWLITPILGAESV